MPVNHVIWAIGFVPNQCAAEWCFWWHWTKSKTGICANDALSQHPFWSLQIERLVEDSQQTSEETSKTNVKYQVEQKNFSYKIKQKKKIKTTTFYFNLKIYSLCLDARCNIIVLTLTSNAMAWVRFWLKIILFSSMEWIMINLSPFPKHKLLLKKKKNVISKKMTPIFIILVCLALVKLVSCTQNNQNISLIAFKGVKCHSGIEYRIKNYRKMISC